MSLLSETERAQKCWPNQPLILLEIDGTSHAAPVGHVFMFSMGAARIRIIGIMHADGSLTIPATEAA